MSSLPLDNDDRPNGEVSVLVREITTLIVKAGLSSIPMAGFVFDVAEKGFNFLNARQQRLLLEKLAERIAEIGKEVDNKLEYQDMFNCFFLKINDPVPDEFINFARNVCINIGNSKYKGNEIRDILKNITPNEVFVLKAYAEFWSENELIDLNKKRNSGIGEDPGIILANYIKSKTDMKFSYIYAAVISLRQKAILQPGMDGGVFGNDDYADPVELTDIGEEVWQLLAPSS